ncbi:hypothetical protein EGH21_15460 [Halomicroarcula sp. F13]|uniref:Uncharacterized protein n=1 Tax=Haloarcula rubra TaxID=2487747 RepID=A0AAW4PTB3_9EURY|nr:hypothetical protein [Halomicroarcula rubra]MBX0324426.1 hypothetical protein [Halomicroarcula rubra]
MTPDPPEQELRERGRGNVSVVNCFPDWRADGHYEAKGRRWNQRPVELVEAGLSVVDTSEATLGMVTAIEATPNHYKDDTGA